MRQQQRHSSGDPSARTPPGPSAIPATNTIPALDGLRAAACLMVFTVHVHGLASPHFPIGIASRGWSGILSVITGLGPQLFVVLSGFLITRSLMTSRLNLRTFFVRRVRRIYPVYLAALGTYLVLFHFFPQFSKLPQDSIKASGAILENLALLPLAFGAAPLITVSWSLGVFVSLYLVAPLLFVLLRLGCRAPWIRAFVYVSIVLAVSCVGLPGLLGWGLALFYCGALAWEMSNRGLPKPWCLGLITVAGLAFRTVQFNGFWQAPLAQIGLSPLLQTLSAAVATVPILLLSVRLARGRLYSLLTCRPVNALSRVSYSFYLFHGVTLKALSATAFAGLAAGAPGLFPILVWPAALMSALAVSLIAHELIEGQSGPRELSAQFRAGRKTGLASDPSIVSPAPVLQLPALRS